MKNRGDKWTTEEVSLAKELYQKGMKVSDIAPRVNHTDKAVFKKMQELKLTGSRRVLWTDKDIEQLKDLFNRGLTYPEMAEIMGKFIRACQSRAVRLGLKKKECNVWLTNKRADFWTDTEVETLKKSIAAGLFMPDILKVINRSEKCIFNKMHELDLHFREKTEIEKSNYRRAYTVDDNYFENIDTQKRAYWLGWLITDGYILTKLNTKRGVTNVNSIGLKLSEKDRYVLEDFKKDLNTDVSIKTIKSRKVIEYTNKITNKTVCIKGGNQAELRFSSAKMVQDLEKFGIHQNKTYDVVFPKELDSKYYPGFIAGVISGDGCVDIKKNHNKGFILRCSIAGNYDLLENIKNILVKEIGFNKEKKILKKKDSVCLYLLEFNQTETIALHYWLEENGTALMERKSRLIEGFLNEREKMPA